jgi:uncharacterized repeat protein (TIGR02543 family)
MKKTKTLGIIAVMAIIAFAAASCGDSDSGDTSGPSVTTYTVTFAHDNGSANTTQTVTENGKAIQPQDPAKDYDVAGLYLGTPAYTFAGWFAPEATSPFNFSTPITADITLTAKWTAPSPTPITTITANDVAAAVTYVKANASAGAYTLFIDGDVTCARQTLDVADFKLTIAGIGSERKINSSSNGAFFTVGEASKTGISLTLGNNITLVGNSLTNFPVVMVQEGAAFTMLAGSKVTGNNSIAGTSANGYGAAVLVTGEGSAFTMEGGAVTGNTGTAADVAKFPLGNFLSTTVGATQAISGTHKIADSGADMGKLVTK